LIGSIYRAEYRIEHNTRPRQIDHGAGSSTTKPTTMNEQARTRGHCCATAVFDCSPAYFLVKGTRYREERYSTQQQASRRTRLPPIIMTKTTRCLIVYTRGSIVPRFIQEARSCHRVTTPQAAGVNPAAQETTTSSERSWSTAVSSGSLTVTDGLKPSLFKF
jgi:hypothetical protein